MSRRKPLCRCQICKMRKEICLCADAAHCKELTAQFKTKVFIVMHHREKHLTTNTARLASLSLAHCEIRMRGLPNAQLNHEGFFEDKKRTLLLYPSDDAVELNEEFLQNIAEPINLLVPDGSWRQASKAHKREAILKDVPRVKLPLAKVSDYKLRREPKPFGLATFEAIVRALDILEGPTAQTELNGIFKKMVSGTMNSRMGNLTY